MFAYLERRSAVTYFERGGALNLYSGGPLFAYLERRSTVTFLKRGPLHICIAEDRCLHV